MELLTLIAHGDIIIAPYEVKKQILLSLTKHKSLHNFRFFTKKEIIEQVFFSYDLKTIMYLVEKYDLIIENALMYIKNLYYVENKTYDNGKIDYLVSLKKELIRMKLLKFDDFFIPTLNNKKIIVIGYELIDDLFRMALNKLQSITTVDIITSKLKTLPNLLVHHYHSLNDEVNGIANQIAQLLEQKVKINNIKLANVDDSYNYALNKIFSLYQIPINLNNDTSLSQLKIGKFFLDKFNEIGNINLSLQAVTENFNLNDVLNRDLYNHLIRVINQALGVTLSSKDSLYKLLHYLFNNHKIASHYYDNAVEIINLSNHLNNDDDHVFVLNFNDESCPRHYKDKHYLNDSLAPILNLTSIVEKNHQEKETLITILSNINHLFISYHDSSSFTLKRPSLLIKEFEMNVIDDQMYTNNITYSPSYDQILLAKQIDEFGLYHYKHPLLDTLYSNYQNNFSKNYKSFNNKYHKVEYEHEDKQNLSYSKLDTFFACQFRYYLDNILRVGEFESTFYQFIGNLFHYVLSKIESEDYDVDVLFDEYISSNQEQLTAREKTLLIRLRQELKDSSSFIKEHLLQTEFKIEATEKKIVVSYDDNYDLKAYVDKVMTLRDKHGNHYLVIIDYKTGFVNNKLDNIRDGINIQLPFYYYIIKQDDNYKDYQLGGIYLENVIAGNINRDSKKTYYQQKNDILKYSGYSSANTNILAIFDPTFSDSNFIKSMKLKKDGTFSSYAKVLDEDKSAELFDVITDLLKQATEKINNHEFDINPIKIPNTYHSCDFCQYQDICFKTFKDYRKVVVTGESDGEEDV